VGRILGIDLGTTYSAVAVLDEAGTPTIIPNREGDRITPSVVLFDGDQPVVGKVAREAAASSPLNVIEFVKRQMGNPSWRFVTEGGNQFTAEEISALILKRLQEDAEAHLGESVTDAVITVPAYFSDSQRQSTVDAGRIAGLNVVRIVNEPTAAALAYGLNGTTERGTVLVYDLGGGTFDVTILTFTPERIEVLATGGDRNLGGFDWDNRLISELGQQFGAEAGVDLLEDADCASELRSKAELLKRTLSSRDSASAYFTHKGRRLSVTISRIQFEALTADLLDRTMGIADFVLEDAGLTWPQIDKVLLVGGSTRMPAVAQVLLKRTGRAPSRELHPDEVVALGAAVQAGLVASEIPGQPGLPILRVSNRSREVIDVTAHGLGTIALNTQTDKDFNSVIVPRNTAVPCSVTETYSTVADRQTEIALQITQGDDEDPDYVEVLYRKPIKIPPYPSGAPIEISIGYDASGIVTVRVVDGTTGESLDLPATFKAENNLAKREVEAMQQKIRHITVR
jgi:molecular chaperone DnaK